MGSWGNQACIASHTRGGQSFCSKPQRLWDQDPLFHTTPGEQAPYPLAGTHPVWTPRLTSAAEQGEKGCERSPATKRGHLGWRPQAHREELRTACREVKGSGQAGSGEELQLQSCTPSLLEADDHISSHYLSGLGEATWKASSQGHRSARSWAEEARSQLISGTYLVLLARCHQGWTGTRGPCVCDACAHGALTATSPKSGEP